MPDTPTEHLTSLLARVEGAEGPSRRLDGDLAEALGLVPEWCAERSHRQPDLWRGSGAGIRVETWLAPHFTASVDAILALIERKLPGWSCSAVKLTPDPSEGYVWPRHDSLRQHQGRAATPALALCAALLKALLNTESNHV